MKQFLLLCLVFAWATPRLCGELLGDTVRLRPPPGWERTEPYPENMEASPFPTVRYVHRTGDCEITLTLLPTNLLGFAVKDQPTLLRFNRIAAEPFVSSAPTAAIAEFPLARGLAISTTAAPSPERESETGSRIATVASVLLESKHLVHVAIFHDPQQAPEFVQALQTMFSMRPVTPGPVAQVGR
jgi:hypothetical protein